MPDPALDVRQHLSFLMAALSKKGTEVLEDYLKDYGLTVGSFYIASLIASTGVERMSQKNIADTLQMNVNTVTRYLDDMERKGHAKRTPNPENRKENLVQVTADGYRAVRSAHSHIERVRQMAYEFITPAEYKELRRLLQKFFPFTLRDRAGQSEGE